MRDAFFSQLYEIARDDRRVILLSSDFGAPSLDKYRRDLATQFISTGVAEQNMVNVARGLAMAGKIVYTYAILPFYMRCYEQIRHLCFQNLNVNLVGVGAGFSYSTAGPTHHALEDIAAMRALPNLTILNASDSTMAGAFAGITYKGSGPKYIRLDRASLERPYPLGEDFSAGFIDYGGSQISTIVATGCMVAQAGYVAEKLRKKNIDVGIIDLYRIKPLKRELIERLKLGDYIVTLEENYINGGIGSIISEILHDNNQAQKLLRLGVPDQYYSNYSGREELHRLSRLDVESIAEEILEWL